MEKDLQDGPWKPAAESLVGVITAQRNRNCLECTSDDSDDGNNDDANADSYYPRQQEHST